jgi:hypothetical protein
VNPEKLRPPSFQVGDEAELPEKPVVVLGGS